MDASELRRRGVELLSPVLVPYGFVYQAGEVDRGSGGLYAHGGSHERTVRWNSACAMRSVRSAIASMLPRYCTKPSPAPPLARTSAIPGVLRRFARRLPRPRDESGSLRVGLPRRHHRGVCSACHESRAYPSAARVCRALPGHHPGRLGLGAPQDATGAERCAVSVGPVDRMFATPPDSPGQCEPGLSDDRPRDPRFCYCPELSPRATRSSSS